MVVPPTQSKVCIDSSLCVCKYYNLLSAYLHLHHHHRNYQPKVLFGTVTRNNLDPVVN